jgi:hypothetical protein
MPIRKKRKLPQIGLTFKKKHKKHKYSMKVVGTPDSPKYKVGNNLFNTPSGAAKHITKYEINGWAFWQID